MLNQFDVHNDAFFSGFGREAKSPQLFCYAHNQLKVSSKLPRPEKQTKRSVRLRYFVSLLNNMPAVDWTV